MQIKKNFTKFQKWKIESLIEKYSNNNNANYEIELSNELAYIDDEGREYYGLKKFYHFKIGLKDVFVFDNHNKAIYAVLELNKKYKKNFDILHIDAHRDDAKFQFEYPKEITEKNIDEIYKKSRVSDYLDLMKETKLIKNVLNITQSSEFEKMILPKEEFILNLDIDIFGYDGQVVDLELKIKKIITAWKKSKAVMIATSPGFMNQENAKFLIETFLKKI